MRLNGRSKILVAAVCIATTLILPGCGLFPQEEEVLAPPLVKPKQEDYTVAKVKKGTIINKIQVTGSLISKSDYPLSFELGGRLQGILVKTGDTVQKGQVLAQMDTGDLTNQVTLGDISVQKQKIELNKANDVLKAAKQSKTDAQKQIPSVQADINKAEAAIKSAGYQVQLAKLNVKEATLALTNLQKHLAEAQITSPVTGTIIFIETKLKKGDTAQPYQVLVTVADPSALQISFNATVLSDPLVVKPGMKADLAFDKETIQGEVVSCPYSAPKDKDGNVINKDEIILKVDKLPESAKMGASIFISIILEKKDNALILPLEAVRSYMGRNYIYALEGVSKKEVNVELGVKSATEVEIISGLKEGQQVILR